MTQEEQRLEEARTRTKHWKRWGPYLSERQWGTVREDYSPNGTAWDYFPHDHARSRAYRWGEDGLLGISDNHERLCFALALWNEKDPILKERMFGLTGSQGNHGEDVKDYYFYLDSTPTHSYMKGLYKYPQGEFPYVWLVDENQRRGRRDAEFELVDTGVFESDRYFDVVTEYAKAAPDDLLIRITVTNRGPDPAPLHLLPTLWCRNTWAWEPGAVRPRLRLTALGGKACILVEHAELGRPYRLYCDGDPALLFTENDTNLHRVHGVENPSAFVKDGFHEYVVHGQIGAVNPAREGTKTAAHYRMVLEPGDSAIVRLRLTDRELRESPFGKRFDAQIAQRVQEAEEFYATVIPEKLSGDARGVMRQALAGMLWSKQWYHYDVRRWVEGDSTQPPPPSERRHGRNREWTHLYNDDIISMPDKWEYPWYAAWDLAFHTITLALVDPEFAKGQLTLFLREWYMHPNGQIPAYEWAFGDVNPPVHAWAVWRVYKIDGKRRRQKRKDDPGDLAFLERVFHKLMLNFTWWVNRKDAQGRNIFQGGFLGLDNIGCFDRSAPLPTGGFINQADGTAWMAMYSLNLMRIALELARHNNVYEDIATKFFEHFLHIVEAMNNVGGEGIGLWDEQDEFYYDVLNLPDGRMEPLKVRSMVGLIPLFAVEVLESSLLDEVPEFTERLNWFLNYRPDLANLVSRWNEPGMKQRHLLSLLRGHRMKCLLRRVLDETEFLSDFGVRAISRHHREHPYEFHANGNTMSVGYQPAESNSGLFGGNSNWRGPIWMPVNYLLIESLQKFHHYYGDDFKVECPTGSGQFKTINEIADELSRRLAKLFLKGEDGQRPVLKYHPKLATDPHFKDYVLFHEYFHGDNGRGVGASHQTGWTGLVAKLLQPRNKAAKQTTALKRAKAVAKPRSQEPALVAV